MSIKNITVCHPSSALKPCSYYPKHTQFTLPISVSKRYFYPHGADWPLPGKKLGSASGSLHSPWKAGVSLASSTVPGSAKSAASQQLTICNLFLAHLAYCYGCQVKLLHIQRKNKPCQATAFSYARPRKMWNDHRILSTPVWELGEAVRPSSQTGVV